MECPFLVKYDDGYWLRNLCDANIYLHQSSLDYLVESEGGNAELEADMWCVANQSSALN